MNPRRRPPRRAGCAGFNILELLVIAGIALIVIGMFLPAFSSVKTKAVGIQCLNNQRQIALAFNVWAGDNGNTYPMERAAGPTGLPLFTTAGTSFHYFQFLSNELANPKLLVCPDDRQPRLATNFTSGMGARSVDYLLSLNAQPTNSGMALVGDRHLQITPLQTNGQIRLAANQPFTWNPGRHGGLGYMARTDGSAQRLPHQASLGVLGNHTGMNWLLFP